MTEYRAALAAAASSVTSDIRSLIVSRDFLTVCRAWASATLYLPSVIVAASAVYRAAALVSALRAEKAQTAPKLTTRAAVVMMLSLIHI